VLYECCELVTDYLTRSLPHILDEVDDVLMDIAVRSTNSQERTDYFNAMHEVRLERDDIERKCVENFVELFNENLRSGNSAASKSEGRKDIGMMAMGNAANKIRHNYQQVLTDLDMQISKVLNSADTSASRNPLSPEIVCQAFYNASRLVAPGTEIRLIIFKYFEKNIASSFNDVYAKMSNVIETSHSHRKPGIKDHKIPTKNNSAENPQKIADIEQVVTAKIQILLEHKHVPYFVLEFLLKDWVKLLAKIHLKSGVQSPSWRHAIETAEDLIWSVGNISTKKERDKFDKLWPGLIMRLRNGINMISMTRREETDFISNLSKHRASLTILGALAKSKSNDVTLISTDKIKALKMKLKSTIVQPVVEGMGLDSTVSENNTMPALRMQASKPTSMNNPLLDNDRKEMDLVSIGSEDITLPMFLAKPIVRPFMDELLVDSHDVEGFKSDITGG
jgi:hypothetical protein